MKMICSLIFIAACIIACSNNNDLNTNNRDRLVTDTIVKHDTIYTNNDHDWQQGFNLTHDPSIDSIWFRPVNFYLQDSQCSPIAKDFYRGEFKPGDNETTTALLNLVQTDNDKLRPFYRWCLNKTIIIQDGALAEYTGEPARHYAEKFPKEFFEYMDVDTTLEKYKDWAASIAYSGGDRSNMPDLMKRNCKGCTPESVKRIDQFVADCFGKTADTKKR